MPSVSGASRIHISLVPGASHSQAIPSNTVECPALLHKGLVNCVVADAEAMERLSLAAPTAHQNIARLCQHVAASIRAIQQRSSTFSPTRTAFQLGRLYNLAHVVQTQQGAILRTIPNMQPLVALLEEILSDIAFLGTEHLGTHFLQKIQHAEALCQELSMPTGVLLCQQLREHLPDAENTFGQLCIYTEIIAHSLP